MTAPLNQQRRSPSGDFADVRNVQTPAGNLNPGMNDVAVTVPGAELGQTYMAAGPKTALPANFALDAVFVSGADTVQFRIRNDGGTADPGALDWDLVRIR